MRILRFYREDMRVVIERWRWYKMKWEFYFQLSIRNISKDDVIYDMISERVKSNYLIYEKCRSSNKGGSAKQKQLLQDNKDWGALQVGQNESYQEV